MDKVERIPVYYTYGNVDIKMLRGFHFYPPATVKANTAYCAVVSDSPNITFVMPREGWYDSLSLNTIIWAHRFIPLGISLPRDAVRCWLFKVVEGLPPEDAVIPRRPRGGFFKRKEEYDGQDQE